MNAEKKQKLNNPERFEWIPPKDICRLLNLSEGMRILDVGAGTGYYAQRLTETMKSITIECLDTDPAMVSEIENYYGDNARIHPLLTDGVSYPIEDSSIDAAYSIALFHELNETQRFVSEHKRVLKPGAPLLVIDWEKILESTTRGPSLEYRIETERVVNVLEESGFKNVTVHRDFIYHFGVRCENI
ncbi:MAG: class I SAM-dependent methyltransferase [Spirochaetes bacterium]|nr:class I SAM-dependent methyltransferase [Spirochaetota bacterium]